MTIRTTDSQNRARRPSPDDRVCGTTDALRAAAVDVPWAACRAGAVRP